jgi:phage terminase large subunit|tara:strand:- start:11848 stop:13227 length:1380 start_codon:yes stop_codon:yes gene_type:complete
MDLPNNDWTPRQHQMPVWSFLEHGGKRAIEIAHRRWGKDDVALHRAACAAWERPATYWHCLPEYGQARKAIWTAVNPHTGKRRIDEAFPEWMRKRTNDQEMFIELINGSTWQVIGSDRYNSLVGSGVAGVTFSEWALCNPSAWGYISPMLRENDGWALFITTPRGKNHAFDMYNYATQTDGWFADLSGAEETGAFSNIQLDEIKAEYVSLYGKDFGAASFQQEYLCSFEAATIGSYYGNELATARAESRICEVKHDPDLKVMTSWDIGYSDDTAILFVQVLAGEVRIIDTYSSSGNNLAHYAELIASKPYDYSQHWLPHDAQAKTLAAAGRSVFEQLTSDHGMKNVSILRNTNTEQQGIMAARHLFPRLWIDSGQEDFLNAIGQFRREWDDDKKTFRDRPVHDWTNHYADALRYLAWVWREPPKKAEPKRVQTINIGGQSTVTMNDLIGAVKKRKARYD